MAASVALTAAVGAGVFASANIASASPAADALQVLLTNEANLAGTDSKVSASIGRLETRIDDADGEAELVGAALSELLAAGDAPALADEDALAEALRIVDEYRAALGQITIPSLPAAYERGEVDESSLASVGDALDRVNARSREVTGVINVLGTSRGSFNTLSSALPTQLAEFTATLEATAVAEGEANDEAEEQFRTALVEAAESVASVPLVDAPAVAALNNYQDAVVALREDNERAVLEREERERREAEEARRRG